MAASVCNAASFAEGRSFTSGVRKNLARATPLHLQHASEVFGEDVKTFHCEAPPPGSVSGVAQSDVWRLAAARMVYRD